MIFPGDFLQNIVPVCQVGFIFRKALYLDADRSLVLLHVAGDTALFLRKFLHCLHGVLERMQEQTAKVDLLNGQIVCQTALHLKPDVLGSTLFGSLL